MADSDAVEPSAEPEQAAEAGWTLMALVADEGEEPSPYLSERAAVGASCAHSALWHPSLLARCGATPKAEPAVSPGPPEPRTLRIIADGSEDRLPDGHRADAEEAGAPLIEGGTDRAALIKTLQERLGIVAAPATPEADAVALDFLALGTAHAMLRDLTIAMGHADGLDHDSFTREVIAGAHAWEAGDHATAQNRLRAAFEVLTQARERFYPVDSYLIDLCLIDPAATPVGALQESLAPRAPVTFLMPALALERLAEIDPEGVAALREAITEGWADVCGGAFTETDEPLSPFESIAWQFRRGCGVYRKHLDDRMVETVARRRFGLYPQLPQIAKRFGFRFALHLGFDAGRFPIRPEAKRLWEAPDGTNLETLTRPPLGADRAPSGVQLPWRLALTMKDDHVATLPLVHWPRPVAGWYDDLRRVNRYSPVLSRWVTLNDYFHLTDRPFETFRPEPDQYVTPYLAQAVARRDDRPISRRAEHARLRARVDALSAMRALAQGVSAGYPESGDDPGLEMIEEALETGRADEARTGLDRQEPIWAGALARAIAGNGTAGRPGYLVLNPLGVARRAAVLLPDAALDLRPEGPLRAAQFTDEGVWAIVDLPAFGYAWVPREANPDVPPAHGGALSARDRLLKNETLAVEIDPATGGLRGIKAAREDTARLGQQLVLTGLDAPDGKALATRMRGSSYEVEYAGPALVQAVTKGTLTDPDGRTLASFRQRYRLWTGRPILEIEIALSDLDPAWLDRASDADPWHHALCCRWAWPDPNSMLRRTGLLSPEVTESARPETPDAFDISTRRQRTALLFGGLAHHQRHGTRMLDTLLIAGRETARTFTVGVALDLENPFHAAADLTGPAYVVPTEAGPPRTGPTGWLVQVDSKAVAVTRIEYADPSGEGRGWGLVIHLVETSGHACRCRLRTFRNPVWARQTDFHNELLVDLTIDGDAVMLDLTPHEVARVDVTLG